MASLSIGWKTLGVLAPPTSAFKKASTSKAPTKCFPTENHHCVTFISSNMALLSLSTPLQNWRLMSSRGRFDFTLFWNREHIILWLRWLQLTIILLVVVGDEMMLIIILLMLLLLAMMMMVLTKLYILARSFGAESSRVQANCITWPTWIPASWFQREVVIMTVGLVIVGRTTWCYWDNSSCASGNVYFAPSPN